MPAKTKKASMSAEIRAILKEHPGVSKDDIKAKLEAKGHKPSDALVNKLYYSRPRGGVKRRRFVTNAARKRKGILVSEVIAKRKVEKKAKRQVSGRKLGTGYDIAVRLPDFGSDLTVKVLDGKKLLGTVTMNDQRLVFVGNGGKQVPQGLRWGALQNLCNMDIS